MPLIAPNACDKIDAIVPAADLAAFASKRAALESALTANGDESWTFSIVPGFFKQSDPTTDDLTYDSLTDHFGLAKPSWHAALQELETLNASADEKTAYKLVFCARHGQGYHNLAVEVFGLDAWNDHYSHLGSAKLPNGEVIEYGPDPFLTSLGEEQAKSMHDAFEREISDHGCPIPSKLYSSPFTRSAQTLTITMDGITVSKEKTMLKPIVTENLRETIGGHLCDKRSTMKIFNKRLANWGFEFENGFQEEDLLYKDDERECLSDHAIRAYKFLNMLFSTANKDQIVYTASHSGTIKALLVATGHRAYTVPTAGMIPLLIKGEKK